MLQHQKILKCVNLQNFLQNELLLFIFFQFMKQFVPAITFHAKFLIWVLSIFWISYPFMIGFQYTVHLNGVDRHPFSSFFAKDSILQELWNAKLFSSWLFCWWFIVAMPLLIRFWGWAIGLSIQYYRISKTLTWHSSFIWIILFAILINWLSFFGFLLLTLLVSLLDQSLKDLMIYDGKHFVKSD